MKHFKYFDNETAYNVERNGNYREPWVSWTEERGLDWNKSIDEKMPDEYLTFDIISDGVINWKANGGIARTISYSKNGGAWTDITARPGSSTTPANIDVVAGDKVRFKGSNSYYYDYEEDDYSNFGGQATTCRFNLYGNIMSLLYGDDFKTATSLKNISSDSATFMDLFSFCDGLIDASNLVLPATTLYHHCYNGMFSYCTNLITAPKILPATTLAGDCYSYMFNGCSSLTTAPVLPATTLVAYCYQYMFNGCSSLTTAPVLPATTLQNYCYYYMFNGCSSLTTAPVLPATTLQNYCYRYMFNGCSSLNYIKAMFTTTPSTTYIGNWVSGVAETGTFVKNASAQWDVTGVSGVPTGWTIETSIE